MAELRVGIVGGRKASDTALCRAVASAFPAVTIVQYQIPVTAWPMWLWRRIRERGLSTLIGHLALSTFLRLTRLLDRIRGRSLWQEAGLSHPSWSGMPRRFAWNEQQLINQLRGCDVIVLLDAFRLSHRFFRQLPMLCLQIVWGMSPDYMGDSGAYWAHARGDHQRIGASVLLRTTQFNKLSIISELPIVTNDHDSLRSIKVKQVATLAKHLPTMIHTAATRQHFAIHQQTVIAHHYYAPTLWTYLRFMSTRSHKTLPAYAQRAKSCTLITLSL